MTQEALDIQFQEAFERASNITHPIPQDVMLRLYAYYKQATFEDSNYKQKNNPGLIDAFKTNAWMQISHLTQDEAKICYINTVNEILKNS